jgi:hypothetical protein
VRGVEEMKKWLPEVDVRVWEGEEAREVRLIGPQTAALLED